jgi:hypothetical protein
LLDIARIEGMQIQHAIDGHLDRLVHHSFTMILSIEGSGVKRHPGSEP